MRFSRIMAALILAAAFAGLAAAQNSAPMQETTGNAAPMQETVGNKVYCLCGCVTELNRCPHLECQMKSTMHQVIGQDAAAGKSEHAILQDLVDRYGQRVLAAPPKQGFNLTAWLLPGLALAIGLIIALAVVERWRRPAPTPATPAPMDDDMRAAIEDEMRRMTE